MIPPKTFAQWLANYIDKPTPRGQLAREWAYLRSKTDAESDGDLMNALNHGLWNGELARQAPAVYYAAARAYAVYAARHAARWGYSQ